MRYFDEVLSLGDNREAMLSSSRKEGVVSQKKRDINDARFEELLKSLKKMG